MNTAEALIRVLESPNVADSNGECANVVDSLNAIAQAAFGIRRAILPADICGGKDRSGGHVECLTEAVMGINAGLVEVASAINNLAEAVRESQVKQ